MMEIYSVKIDIIIVEQTTMFEREARTEQDIEPILTEPE